VNRIIPPDSPDSTHSVVFAAPLMEQAKRRTGDHPIPTGPNIAAPDTDATPIGAGIKGPAMPRIATGALETLALPQGMSQWMVRVVPEDQLNDADTYGGKGQKTAAEAMPPASYELRKIVGRGGMGEVWEAVQVALGRTVAVKRLRRESPDGRGLSPETLVEREVEFRREAVVAACLEHPNIVPVHDLGTDFEGSPLIAMKLVQGKNWDAMIKEDWSHLSPEDFLGKHLPILVSMAQAVAFAHARNIVHRDLKPGQVMVGEYGEVLLMDWGLAVYIGEEKDRQSGLTLPTRETAANPAGTPSLMAIEQTESDTSMLGTWTDIYLLGGTLYHLLTGTFPHTASTPMAAFLSAIDGRVALPSERSPDRLIPSELSALALECLRREPPNRLGSAKEFVDRLRDFLTGSGRRRESQQLVAESSKRLDSSLGTYNDLSSALADVQRALTLWPANILAESMRADVHTRYAKRALALGDLALAAVHVEMLDQGPPRDALAADLERRHSVAAWKNRTRTVALGIIALLVIVILAGGAFLYRAVVSQRNRAQASRENAERLVTFLIDDLREPLRDLGRLDILMRVATEAIKYFEEVPESDRTPRTEYQRSIALRIVAQALSAQGDYDRAQHHANMAREVAALLIERAPQQYEFRLNHARCLNTLSALAWRQSRYDDSEAISRLAINELENLLVDSPNPAMALHELAELNQRIGQLASRRGDVATWLTQAQAVRDIRERSVAMNEGNFFLQLNLAISMNDMAEALLANERPDEAIETIRRSVEMQTNLTQGRKSDFNLRRLIFYSHLDLAGMMERQGKTKDAVSEIVAGNTIIDSLIAADPANGEWRVDSSRGAALEGHLRQESGETTAARERTLDGYELMLESLRLNPGDGMTLRYAAAVIESHGQVSTAIGSLSSLATELEPIIDLSEPFARAATEVAGLARGALQQAHIWRAVSFHDQGALGRVAEELELARRFNPSPDDDILAGRYGAALQQWLAQQKGISATEQRGDRPRGWDYVRQLIQH